MPIFRIFNFYGLCTLALAAGLTACGNVAEIRAGLVKETPLGAEMSRVLAFCKREKMQCKRSDTAGFLNQDTGQIVGVKSVWGLVTERKSSPLSTTSTEAYWGFDKDGHLLDVWVWRTTDAP